MNKIIVLDFGIFQHRAIFATLNNPTIPATYTCMSMIIGNLARIGIDETDTVIVACDHLKSWRKDLEESYKANRAQKRAESPIDWHEEYRKMDELLDTLDISTNWHIIKLPHLEADDIMAVCSRYFKDNEVVLVTYDSDLEQMFEYTNIKIFSPQTKKWKLKPENFNVWKLISKKINKETTDNLVSPILNEEDYKIRNTCINLLQLPEWVEELVVNQLKQIQPKIPYLEAFPFDSLRARMDGLFQIKDKVIDYNKQLTKALKKKSKKSKGGSRNGKV